MTFKRFLEWTFIHPAQTVDFVDDFYIRKKFTLNKSNLVLNSFANETLWGKIKLVGNTVDKFKNDSEIKFLPELLKVGGNQVVQISYSLPESRVELVLDLDSISE